MPDTPTRNLKPTFQLTPLDKPDMSPYLFHLTTKDSLIEILRVRFLKLQKPRGSHSSRYPYAMVCFTESPPFALDFFRYRWNDNKDREDLTYGIGFSKEKMVKKGVFPTAYLDKNLINFIQWLQEKLNSNREKYETEIKKMHALIGQISPLILGSIDDKNNLQGYSWEREWRYTKGKQEEMKEQEEEEEYQLKFEYDDIMYICCPDEDKNQIQEIVKDNQNIKYLKTWEEYNEIIDFLDTKDFDRDDEVEELEEKQRRIGSLINRYESGYQQIDKLKERLDHIAIIIEEKKKEKIKREIIIKIISDKLGREAADGGIEKTIRDMDTKIDLIINNLAYTLCRDYKDAGKYLYKSIEVDYYSTCKSEIIDKVNEIRNKIIDELNQSLERYLDLEG